jgi:hypothetical protein
MGIFHMPFFHLELNVKARMLIEAETREHSTWADYGIREWKAKRALDPCGERPYPVGQRTVRRRRYRAHPFFRQDGYMDPFRRGFKRRFSGSAR